VRADLYIPVRPVHRTRYTRYTRLILASHPAGWHAFPIPSGRPARERGASAVRCTRRVCCRVADGDGRRRPVRSQDSKKDWGLILEGRLRTGGAQTARRTATVSVDPSPQLTVCEKRGVSPMQHHGPCRACSRSRGLAIASIIHMAAQPYGTQRPRRRQHCPVPRLASSPPQRPV